MVKLGTKSALFGYFRDGIWKQHSHILNQHSWICLITKFWKIMKMPKFGPTNILFGYFWTKIFKKNCCHIWNQHPQICLIINFSKIQKFLNFGPKMTYLGIFDQKCLICRFLDLNSRGTFVTFEISTFEYV